jgi:uncharacterized protein with HEPN domain
MAPRRSLRPRLQDILDNIAIVSGAVVGRDFDSFAVDPVLRLAIERAIEIISEAVRHIPEELRNKHPAIPWRNIIAIGNKLRHEYQRIDPDIIWEIAQKHLNDLRPVVEAMIAELEAGER